MITGNRKGRKNEEIRQKRQRERTFSRESLYFFLCFSVARSLSVLSIFFFFCSICISRPFLAFYCRFILRLFSFLSLPLTSVCLAPNLSSVSFPSLMFSFGVLLPRSSPTLAPCPPPTTAAHNCPVYLYSPF